MDGSELEPAVLTGEVVVAAPPADWPLIGEVMTNLDRSCGEAVAARLREGGAVGQHSAWDFCGYVWFQAGRWYERVLVRHTAVASYQAEDLKTLMIMVNERHGWR